MLDLGGHLSYDISVGGGFCLFGVVTAYAVLAFQLVRPGSLRGFGDDKGGFQIDSKWAFHGFHRDSDGKLIDAFQWEIQGVGIHWKAAFHQE